MSEWLARYDGEWLLPIDWKRAESGDQR